VDLVGVDLVGLDQAGVVLVGVDLFGVGPAGMALDLGDLGKEEDLVTTMSDDMEHHHSHHQHQEEGTDQATVDLASVQVSRQMVVCRHSQKVVGIQEAHQAALRPQVIILADHQELEAEEEYQMVMVVLCMVDMAGLDTEVEPLAGSQDKGKAMQTPLRHPWLISQKLRGGAVDGEDLVWADLDGVDLVGAGLYGVVLVGADQVGVDLVMVDHGKEERWLEAYHHNHHQLLEDGDRQEINLDSTMRQQHQP
jgi:hypothetical protein